LHTENEVLIRADSREVYRLAAGVERWPELLVHYRKVKVLRDDGNWRLVEMYASRSSIPVRWRAEQSLYPQEPRITFKHVGGITTGMEVKWLFSPWSDGSVRVSILHDLPEGVRWPIGGRLVAERIVGPYFVSDIAGKTLQRIKELAEANRARI
jgi:uncharacterized membrane protein